MSMSELDLAHRGRGTAGKFRRGHLLRVCRVLFESATISISSCGEDLLKKQTEHLCKGVQLNGFAHFQRVSVNNHLSAHWQESQHRIQMILNNKCFFFLGIKKQPKKTTPPPPPP